VQRPRGVFDVVNSLLGVALITFVALKLAGAIAWSWWWVLSPLWICSVPLAVVTGGLVTLWCLGRWQQRRQARLFLRFVPSLVPSACPNGPETTDIKRYPGDEETHSHQESSS